MLSSRFFKGLSWLITLNLLVKPVWIFFIDRQVQNLVGNTEYGSYFAVLSLSYVLFFISDAGLSNMLNQRIANGLAVDSRQLLRLKLLLLLFYVILCLFIAWLTGITRWDLLAYVIGVQALTSFFVFLRSIVTAHQYFRPDAFLSIIDKLLMILFCGGLIYTSFFGTIDLILFLQLQLLSTLLAIAAAFIFIIRKGLWIHHVPEDMEKIIRYITPFALSVLLMSVLYRLDGFLLERISGPTEAGIYALAFRLLDASNMAGYLAASFLVPFIAREEKQARLVETTVLWTRHGLLLLATGVLSFVLVFTSWLQEVLYHTSIPYHSLVMQLLLATLPAFYLLHVYGSLLTATRRFRSFLTIMTLSVLINIVLNLALIPSLGAKGACIAALVSHYFCGIANYLVATRHFSLDYGHRWNLVYFIWTALLCGLFYSAKLVVKNVWVILAIAVLAAVLLLIILARPIKNYFRSLR